MKEKCFRWKASLIPGLKSILSIKLLFMERHRLVVLGGGFAGTWIATHASPARRNQFDVTLISEEPTFTFSPLLINGLAGDLAPQDFTLDLTKLASDRGFRFIQGMIQLIDREKRTVQVKQLDGTQTEVAYDSAVLATGAQANFFDIPGLEHESFTLKRLADVDHLIGRLGSLLDEASKLWTDEDKRRVLSFLIVGGGPTGIELLGAMQSRLKRLANEHALESLLPFVSITLVESNTLLFYGFPEELCKGSEEVLKRNGVTIRCGMRMVKVEKGVASFSDGSTLSYGTLIWAAGVKPITPPIQPAFPAGPLKPNACLQLDEHLYGAGDAVQFEENGVRFPKNAQSALRMAHDILENIVRAQKGQPLMQPKGEQSAALVTVLDTGFFRIGSLVLKGAWVHPFRKLLYRLRLWQIRTGH